MKEHATVEKLLFTVKETQTSLGIGKTTVYRLIANGALLVRKIGGKTMILASSVRSVAVNGIPHRKHSRLPSKGRLRS